MLRACTRLGVAVVTQAGNTGLVGGGVPRPDGAEHRPTVVLSMRRLDAHLPTGCRVDADHLRRGGDDRRLATRGSPGRARHAGRLRRARLGHRRRGDRHQRRRVAGGAVRHDAPAGRRHRGGARRRHHRRLTRRSGEGDRRYPLAVAAGRIRGNAGRDHRRAAAPRAALRPRHHGAGCARRSRVSAVVARRGASPARFARLDRDHVARTHSTWCRRTSRHRRRSRCPRKASPW